MMRLLTVFVLVLIQQTVTANPHLLPDEAELNKATTAAQQALPMFDTFVRHGNQQQPNHHQALGFEKAADAKQVSLGEPMPIFMIGLTQLRNYQAGSDAHTLLSDTHKLVFPVLVKHKVASSVTLKNSDGQWQAVEFGNKQLIDALTAVRKSLRANQKHSSASTEVVVHVAALNTYFLGYWDAENTFYLTPIKNHSHWKLTKGASKQAQKVIEEALQPAARAAQNLEQNFGGSPENIENNFSGSNAPALEP